MNLHGEVDIDDCVSPIYFLTLKFEKHEAFIIDGIMKSTLCFS